MQATGDLQLSNSADGQAIFQASGLAPGRSVTGTVQLTNSGTLPGDLSLQQLDVSDSPGPGGGRLSNVVTLDITRRDAAAAPSPSSPASSAGSAAARSAPSAPARRAPSASPRSLPDMDNAFAGSGLTVRYAWNATAAGGGPGPSEQPVATFKLNSKKLLKRALPRRDGRPATSPAASRPRRSCPRRGAARRPPKSRVRTATLTTPNQPARIRLKISKKAQRGLKQVLKKKRRAVVKVRLEREPRRGRNRHAPTPRRPPSRRPSASAARR